METWKRKRVDRDMRERKDAELTLIKDDRGVLLTDGNMTMQGDFTRMMARIRKTGLGSELLVKAAKPRKQEAQREERPFLIAIDATAGLGEDSFLLAAAGYRVLLFEKNDLVAALLQDAISRAAVSLEDSSLAEIAGRMHFCRGDSILWMRKMAEDGCENGSEGKDGSERAGESEREDESEKEDVSAGDSEDARILQILHEFRHPDVILLDPMFPAKTGNARSRKKLQMIQKLELPCTDEQELLQAAMGLQPGKIIIKRPLKGPELGGVKPSYSITGKLVRYDCLRP